MKIVKNLRNPFLLKCQSIHKMKIKIKFWRNFSQRGILHLNWKFLKKKFKIYNFRKQIFRESGVASFLPLRKNKNKNKNFWFSFLPINSAEASDKSFHPFQFCWEKKGKIWKLNLILFKALISKNKFRGSAFRETAWVLLSRKNGNKIERVETFFHKFYRGGDGGSWEC